MILPSMTKLLSRICLTIGNVLAVNSRKISLTKREFWRIIQFIVRYTKAPTLPSSAAGGLALCLNIDCDPGLEAHGEVILEYSNLDNQSLDQRLVKLSDVGGLILDEILE